MPEMGKIKRLPAGIREELNQRLHNGAENAEVLEWVNGLPEARAVLAEHFRGEPLKRQNLDEWRKGGLREWEARQKAAEVLEECAGEDGAGLPAALRDKLAQWLAVRYVAAAREAAGEAQMGAEEWKVLRGVSLDIARMRRGDQNERWLDLEERAQEHRERLALLRVAETVLEVAEDPGLHEKICPQCSKPVSYTPKLWEIGRRMFGDEEVDEWEREKAITEEKLKREQEEQARRYVEHQKKVQGDKAMTFWKAVCIATGQKDDGAETEGNGQNQAAANDKSQLSRGKRRTNDQSPNPKE